MTQQAMLLTLMFQNVMMWAIILLVFRYFDRKAARDREQWQVVLNDLNNSHAEELKRLANMKVAGTTEIPAAVRIPMKPDAEARASAQIREETIQRGAERLKEEYHRAGMALSDEEARLQAEAMLSGRQPSLD